MYVADWRNDRVQKFTSEGKFLAAYGTQATTTVSSTVEQRY